MSLSDIKTEAVVYNDEKAYAVKNYENIYWLTKTGKLYSGRKKNMPGDKPMYWSTTRQVYKIVSLTKNKKRKVVSQHRLLALQFIPNPNNYRVVNHIDGNKANNILSNLEWCTDSENTKHAHRTGLMKDLRTIYGPDFYKIITAKGRASRYGTK